MTGRGRNYSQSNEWDSTRDDYNSSIYDPQYADDEASGGVSLDHCRLYIKNIPKGLNEEGLRAAFAKFGSLVEVFLSKDPQKTFGLVRYETPGEAKLAMMKMNRTEPLKLYIRIAHKNRKALEGRPSKDWQDKSTNGGRDRNDRMSLSNRDREESGSVISRGRNSRAPEEIPTGENMDELLMEDDYGFSDILDPNLHLELESLKLEQLKVREEQLQCKQRVILLKQAERRPMAQMSNRCILPDGKIVVRNANDRDARDADVSFSAGAGDSLNLPGLQCVAAKHCVLCGSSAGLYCAGCAITPYCSERCQRRDWENRHMSVCHNLARVQPAMPLRRPHFAVATNFNRHEPVRDEDAGHTSKASVKSADSGGKGDRYYNIKNLEKPRQPSNPRNFNQENGNEPAKTTQRETPNQNSHQSKQDSFSKQNFNRTPHHQKAPVSEVKKAEEAPKKNEYTQPASPAKNNLVPKRSDPEPSTHVAEAIKPQPPTSPAAVPVSVTSPVVKPASVSDVTPTRKLIPKNYMIEKMSVGDTIILSVESTAAESRINRGHFVCVTMAVSFEEQYQSLCEEFVLECDKDEQPYKLIPGETCTYFNPVDGGWYRARCLNPTTIALLDAGKIVTITSKDKCRKLPAKYEAIPEFSAVLESKAVEVGANLTCKILSQTTNGYKISMAGVENDTYIGEGEVFRWLPTVEYLSAPTIPEVERPPVTDGSKVLLVLATSLEQVFVRPADSDSQMKYDDVLQQVLLKAMNAKPLSEPPMKGQTVIGKFSDGNHYRALVRRTNVKQNKYQIEYVEYGNIEISTLENLFPCPPEVDLLSIPAQVSMVKLSTATELTPAAIEFVDAIKDVEELVLTLPDGRKTAPSGSEATLTMVKNRLNLNKRLVDMCKPEWKKIEEKGGDVVEMGHIMYSDLKYTVLPQAGCTIEVLDISVLRGGVVSGYDRNDKTADVIFKQLSEKMADYCNSGLGRDPYLPKPEELCIAQLPPYPQWFRAVFLELVSGPGSSEGRVCYVDYGNIATVPVTLLRKMMPEFITGYPIMGLNVEIRGYPSEPTHEMLARAIEYMKIDDEGRGTLKVTNCVKQSEGIYAADAPELLKAMMG